MIELGLVVALLAALLGGATLYAVLPWHIAFGVGIWLVALGLALGVPTGVVYHVQLYRRLQPRGELERRWWIAPIKQHVHLRDGERLGVLAWCALGALGFLIAMAGCVVLVAGVLRAPG